MDMLFSFIFTHFIPYICTLSYQKKKHTQRIYIEQYANKFLNTITKLDEQHQFLALFSSYILMDQILPPYMK